MTVIAGVVSGGKVYIGGDSAGVNSNGDLQIRKDPKVFIRGEFLVGVAGSWRAVQQIRYEIDFPKCSSGDEHYMTYGMLLPAIRKGIRLSDDEDFETMIGFRGRLFHTYGTRQVSEEIADYEACGCGAQVARGAMYAGYPHMIRPQSLLTSALEAAERFCSGVRAPFTILEI